MCIDWKNKPERALLGGNAEDEAVHILGTHVHPDVDLVMGGLHQVGDHPDQVLPLEQPQLHQHSLTANASRTPEPDKQSLLRSFYLSLRPSYNSPQSLKSDTIHNNQSINQ